MSIILQKIFLLLACVCKLTENNEKTVRVQDILLISLRRTILIYSVNPI